MNMTISECAKMIDHSLLNPSLTDEQMKEGCLEALRHKVASVCIKPYAVPLAKNILDGSDILVGTVIGFPHGNATIGIKEAEAREACRNGASEIDMVINPGKVLGDDWDYIEKEIRAINDCVQHEGSILKVIFENDYLEDRHIIRLCEISTKAQVAFIKTSTGYGFVKQTNGYYETKGATLRHLALMRAHSGAGIQIKAAGGIRTLRQLLDVRALGVTRIGATATASILAEAKALADSEGRLAVPDVQSVIDL